MNRLLLRSSRRFYVRHPWQLALAIAGISLGVAVYVGVDLANDSARRAFELASEAVQGRTTHRLLPVGGDLPESVYSDLVTRRGITQAAPVIEAELRLARNPARRFTLLGVDPLKEPDVRGFVGYAPGSTGAAARLMIEPGTVLLPQDLAEQIGAEPERRLDVLVNGRRHTVTVLGTVRGAGDETGVPVIGDIGSVQVLADMLGFIDRVDLRLDDDTARQLAADPPAGTTLVSAGDRQGFGELTRAFRTNLTALGLLALVVGMFLIYSTMSFAILQRRKVMGALIAIGFDRKQLLGSVLLEALVIGVVATVTGLVVGHVLAQALVDLVLRTIGDLYFSAQVSGAAPSPWIYARGAVLGVGATLVAALGPSLDAARAAPAAAMRRATLERRTHERARLAAWLAIPVAALGALSLLVESQSLYLAFAGLFFALIAGALLTPSATAALMRAIEPVAARSFGLPGRLAVRGVTASLSRTGVATAALAVAVATVIGVGLMISSFRASLIDWLDTTLTADLYVTLGDAGDAAEPQLVEAMSSLPGVAGLSLSRFSRLPTELGDIGVRAVRPGPDGFGLDLVSGVEAALAEVASGRAVAVSEPFAFRRGLAVGDSIALPTPAGSESFLIAAVFRDYNTGGSSLVMSLERYRAVWQDHGLSNVGVHLAEGADGGRVSVALRALLPAGIRAPIRSTAGLVDLSLEVFDRTFKITEVLRILAALIAFLGVLSALLSIQIEKSRELAVLRAVGFAPRQLGMLTLIQTTLLGLAAGLAAIPVGVVLAGLLVHVINRRSFGWSMELELSSGPVLSGLALAVGASLLAGLYPAVRVQRMQLTGALREE